jgi:hypothetical protein
MIKPSFSSMLGPKVISRDLKRYLSCYEGEIINDKRLNKNVKFYQNQICSAPRGKFCNTLSILLMNSQDLVHCPRRPRLALPPHCAGFILSLQLRTAAASSACPGCGRTESVWRSWMSYLLCRVFAALAACCSAASLESVTLVTLWQTMPGHYYAPLSTSHRPDHRRIRRPLSRRLERFSSVPVARPSCTTDHDGCTSTMPPRANPRSDSAHRVNHLILSTSY